ncbi:MAG: SDR family NAD(P)-dependent oxidoreductase [Jatrophihabitantaceae bacterium]
MRLADASALVTGSSRGIGAAVARALAARGARVVLHGRDGDRLRALAAELDAVAHTVDLLDPSGPATLAAHAGPVDILVHSAGVGWRGSLRQMSGKDVDRLLTVNLRAPLELTRALLPAMVEAGRGHVAFVTSIAGLSGVAHEAVYSAAKGGLAIFADALAAELAGTGVTVSSIAPGAVDTDFWTTRGAAYGRRCPRLISAQRVGELLVRDIERGDGARVVPRWLAIAPAVRAVAPGLYRRRAPRLG